jgi:CRP-like cAMP-binding protein
MFNAAEFERLLAEHPSMGIRLLKLLAERMIVAARAMH